MVKPSAIPVNSSSWSADDSAELYGVRNWGCDFFDISESGDLVARARANSEQTTDVPVIDIIQGMQERGMEMPAILRIENILDQRIAALNQAFARAIEAFDYQNVYRGVYPIKVNQQCHVVEEIASFGSRYHHGLEAGSKAELIMALSKLQDNQSIIVCNGYKDSEFIELGLYAKAMGIPCIFVLETPAELPDILECSAALGIEPILGMRIRSSVPVDGHWSHDSGDRFIFGMSTATLMRVVEQLKEAEMLHCLQLLHCHLGSQIPNIRNIRNGVAEACRFYCGLIEEGAPMGYLDLGGGLAVDYEGVHSNSTHSMNYQLDEYCVNIVETICESLTPKDIPHPVIITESGRATVAYSSMLLFNVLDVRTYEPSCDEITAPEEGSQALKSLYTVWKDLGDANYQECYNDALYYRDELRALFQRGQVSLRERAKAEQITLAVLQRVARYVQGAELVPSELEDLPAMLADIYYCNFSLFQSLPDMWAIDQVFPVMPIHRLNEQPDREAVIADLTCDCDGKIDKFVTGQGVRSTLPVHKLKEGSEYYLAVFLIGAYQETLGDLHNLFGDTNVVSVKIDDDGSYHFVREFHGDTIADVLSYVAYDPKVMVEELRVRAEGAVRSGRITAKKRKEMMAAFKASLDGYTYFEKETL